MTKEFDVYMPFVDSGVDMIGIHRTSKKILKCGLRQDSSLHLKERLIYQE